MHRKLTSRLSCQLKWNEELDGLLNHSGARRLNK
jgi:hypothetical protein